MDPLDIVTRKLCSIEGVIDVWPVDAADRTMILQLEEKANANASIAGMPIVNEGAKLALTREFVVCINHSPTLRHPTNPILVLVAGKEIIGQEVWEDDIARFHADPNVIFLGKGFVVFRDKLNSAGENRPRFEYRAQRFPELETIENISEVVSATVSSDTDIYIKRKAKWDVNDASIGTVMIGFNFSGN